MQDNRRYDVAVLPAVKRDYYAQANWPHGPAQLSDAVRLDTTTGIELVSATSGRFGSR